MGSGLDINAIVEKLITAEIKPASDRIDKRESNLKLQLSALGQVKSNLSKFQTTLQKLSNLKEFYSLKANVSKPEFLTATIGDKAAPGSYQVEVKNLATKQNLASGAFASSTTSIGTGSITINFGKYTTPTTFDPNTEKTPVTINVTSGQDSLINIRDAINKGGSGVNASIITDSTGAHLVLSSPDTGENLAMKITVNDADTTHTNNTGLSQLAFDPTAGVNQMVEKTAALNSKVVINGLELSNNSNQLKTAIEGVTLDLKKAEIGTVFTLGIENNKGQINANIQEFIKQYNETMSSLNAMTSYNKETKQPGLLQADAGIRAVKLKLYEFASKPIDANGTSLSSLANLGITSTKDGFLTLNTTTLDKVMDEHFSEIGAVFAKTATATDSNITINSLGKSIKPGSYSVNLTAYTQGSVLEGSIGQAQATSTDGITLTGSGNYAGLSINVTGGTTGNRGQIIVTDGLASRLDSLIDSYFGTGGDFTQRTNQLNKQNEGLATERKALSTKIDKLSKRYKAQFIALDQIISKMNSTATYLSQQFGG